MIKLAFVLAMLAVLIAPTLAMAETGQERQTACNAEWKQHKADNGKPAKGEGRAAYRAFYTECSTKRKEADKAAKTASK